MAAYTNIRRSLPSASRHRVPATATLRLGRKREARDTVSPARGMIIEGLVLFPAQRRDRTGGDSGAAFADLGLSIAVSFCSSFVADGQFETVKFVGPPTRNYPGPAPDSERK
eukprot:707930-Hanusia_phi.AAC.1